jgi:hypothetical protein
MTTKSQQLANRRNAQKSTGPRTVAGRAIVKLNAMRHGLRAATVVVPGLEMPADWEKFRVGIVASLNPIGLLEETLADRAAGFLWRLRRVERFESLSVAADHAELEIPSRPGSDKNSIDLLIDDNDDTGVSDSEILAERDEKLSKAMTKLAEFRQISEMAARLPPMKDGDALDAGIAAKFVSDCADFAEGEGVDNTVPSADDADGLLRVAGLPTDTDSHAAKWTVGAVRKAVSAINAGMNRKRSDAEFMQDVADWADEWIEDAEGEIKLYAPEVEILRRRFTLLSAIARARRIIVDDQTAGQIARYEGHLQRQFTKTLDELERLQGRRQKSAAAVG